MASGSSPSELSQGESAMYNGRKRRKHGARNLVSSGAITQDVECKYGSVQRNDCALCGGSGVEKHGLLPL